MPTIDDLTDSAAAPGATAAHRPAHGLLREGLVTGALGASAVALWFLVVDLVMGRPLHTPALLGALVSGTPDAMLAAEGPARTTLALLYTVVHYLGFAAVGVLAVFLVHRAERAPALLALLLLLFAVIEVAFVGFVAVLEVQAVGDIAWYQVAAGNLVAAVTMGWYLWRSHPAVSAAYAGGFGAT